MAKGINAGPAMLSAPRTAHASEVGKGALYACANNIRQLHDRVSSLAITLNEISENALGSEPETDEESSETEPRGNGGIGAIQTEIQRLSKSLSRCESHCKRLTNL